MRFSGLLSLPAVLLVLSACSDDGPSEPATGTLVVQARSAASLGGAPAAAAAAFVDPSSFVMAFYAIYLAEDADCSSPVLVEDYGATPRSFELLDDPTLFTAEGTPGSFNCVVLRISDVLTFVPAATDGPCTAGTTYRTDVYRDGETDWRDVDGTPITGAGEDDSPVDDSPDVFFSTNRAAVIARGYSPNQVQDLLTAADVPGTSTFVYDVANTVVDEGGTCRIVPGTYQFR